MLTIDAAAGRLQHRHGAAGAEELAGEADVDAAPPVGRVDLLDAAGRPGDAGIVDQRVEAAELRRSLVEQAVDLGLVRDIGLDPAGMSGTRGRRRRAPSSATSQTKTRAPWRDQRVGDGAADAAGTGGDQDPLAREPGAEIG